jgi:hypothetical protein
MNELIANVFSFMQLAFIKIWNNIFFTFANKRNIF